MQDACGSEMSSTGTIFIGTAGWSIPARYRSEFPAAGSHLERYAARMNAVEINSSFYRPHRTATYARWAETVPDGFRFSVKIPKAMTHERRLQNCEDLLGRFAAEAGGLGAKLAVLLLQLPPSLSFSAPVLDGFLAALRMHIDVPVACEPRHPSWFGPEAEACFVDHKVARVAADPPPAASADKPGGWPRLAYVRLHGSPRIYYSDYDAQDLDRIGQQLAGLKAAGAQTWCVFDNTAAFHALGNALTVQARQL